MKTINKTKHKKIKDKKVMIGKQEWTISFIPVEHENRDVDRISECLKHFNLYKKEDIERMKAEREK